MIKQVLFVLSAVLQLLCWGCLAAHEYRILGIGAPCMDLLLTVDDEFLKTLPGQKGDSVHLSWPEFSTIVDYGKKNHYSIAAGGSCSNTIKGLASLGQDCALFGKVGKDEMGRRYLQNIANVGVLSLCTSTETPTQQVASLITPDCQRTMYCFPGAADELTAEDLAPEMFEGVQLVYIEGYTLYNGALAQKAMEMAKAAGATVAFDMGCAEVVRRYKSTIQALMENYIDIVFANDAETLMLTGMPPEEGCKLLRDLCGTAVVMIGKNGCWVGSGNIILHCPSVPANVVDTTGAGDLYASGFLHGFLQGRPLAECAYYGNLTGGSVVEVYGAEIPESKWGELRKLMPKEP